VNTPPALRGTLLFRGSDALDTPHGRFRVHTFTDLTAHQPLLALTAGDCSGPAPVLARVHSSCVTGESMGSADCDCAEQLDAGLARIAAAGRGVLFYLLQEGRGAGLVAKARDRMLVQASHNRVTTFDAYAGMGLERDCRRYDAVALACAALGITAPLHLLTNNPDKLASLREGGVALAGCAPLAPAPSPFNLAYLAAKSQSGHALDVAHAPAAAAELPEPVDAIEPAPCPAAPSLLAVASYLVPIAALPPATGVHWLRLHLYVDRESGRERVVLTVARPRPVVPLAHVHAETLHGRFPRPLADDPWRRAVARLATHGAGAALFLLHDEPGLVAENAADFVAARPELARLLAHHLGTRATLLVPNPTLRAALRRAGLGCGA
jgi:GTP cyclohydrolase II